MGRWSCEKRNLWYCGKKRETQHKEGSKGINAKLVFRDSQRAKITSKKSEEKKILIII